MNALRPIDPTRLYDVPTIGGRKPRIYHFPEDATAIRVFSLKQVEIESGDEFPDFIKQARKP